MRAGKLDEMAKWKPVKWLAVSNLRQAVETTLLTRNKTDAEKILSRIRKESDTLAV